MAERLALIQCGDHWENQRRVLSLATQLASEGWEPVVITYARHEGALFLRHGIDVAPLSARGGSAGDDEARRLAFALGRSETYRGVDVAEIARIERARLPDSFRTVAARVRWRHRLARRVDALRAALDDAKPARVYVWNGLTGVVANSLRHLGARREIPTRFLERGLLPDSIFVDAKGTGGQSQLHRRSLDELPARREVVVPQIERATGEDLREKHGLHTARVIFVPLQVERDTNILFHSDAVRSMRALLERASDALSGDDAVIIARRHPEESEAISLPERRNIRYIDQGSVEAWCDAADLVLTVSSTVGLTALLRGRPVVALGRAIYTNKGLCHEPSLAELPALLRDPATYSVPERARIERFYRALIGAYTVCPGAPVQPRPSRRAPLNPHGIEPSDFAARWTRALERARAQPAIDVRWELGADATQRLTYRKQREPIDRARVEADLRAMLHAEQLTPGARPVVLTPQTRHPPNHLDPLLALDPHLEPHAGWLVRERL